MLDFDIDVSSRDEGVLAYTIPHNSGNDHTRARTESGMFS